MKNNNLYKTTEQQDNFIQSLSIDELKTSFVGKSIAIQKADENIASFDDYLDTDNEIQNLQINELRNFVNITKQKEEKQTIQYKITHTGLDENTILLIETNKYRATLEQLINYCNGLKISYKHFLPELFKNINT